MTETPHDAFRSINNRGAKSPELDTAEAWLRAKLATMPPADLITTRDFIASLGVPESEEGLRKRMANGLWWLRKLGRVEDCYQIDDTRRWFGNPLIVWKNPTVAEGQF